MTAKTQNSIAPVLGGLHYVRPAGLLLTTSQLDQTLLPSPLVLEIKQRHEALFDDNSIWPHARVITEVSLSLNLTLQDTNNTFPQQAPHKRVLDSRGDELFEIAGDLTNEAPGTEGASELDEPLPATVQVLRITGGSIAGSEVQEIETLHLFELLRSNPDAPLINHTKLAIEECYAAPRAPARSVLANVDGLVEAFRKSTKAILEAQESPVAPAAGVPEDTGEITDDATKSISGGPSLGQIPARPMVTPERVEQYRQQRHVAMTRLRNFFEVNGTIVTRLSIAELHAQPDIHKVVSRLVEANTGGELAAWLDTQAESMLGRAIISF